MRSSTIKKKMTIDDAASHMRSFETGYRSTYSWSDALQIGASQNFIGEIRTPDDWNSVPRDIHVRAIYLTDTKGPVIRWGNPNTMDRILPGRFHEHLVCKGDELIQAKSGWIRVSKNGEISVSS
jgi:hypothetical protein